MGKVAQYGNTYWGKDADNTNMTIDIELYRTPIAGTLMAVEIERLRQKMNA